MTIFFSPCHITYDKLYGWFVRVLDKLWQSIFFFGESYRSTENWCVRSLFFPTKTCQLGNIARIARLTTFQSKTIFLFRAVEMGNCSRCRRLKKNGIVNPKDIPLTGRIKTYTQDFSKQYYKLEFAVRSLVRSSFKRSGLSNADDISQGKIAGSYQSNLITK